MIDNFKNGSILFAVIHGVSLELKWIQRYDRVVGADVLSHKLEQLLSIREIDAFQVVHFLDGCLFHPLDFPSSRSIVDVGFQQADGLADHLAKQYTTAESHADMLRVIVVDDACLHDRQHEVPPQFLASLARSRALLEAVQGVGSDHDDIVIIAFQSLGTGGHKVGAVFRSHVDEEGEEYLLVL